MIDENTPGVEWTLQLWWAESLGQLFSKPNIARGPMTFSRRWIASSAQALSAAPLEKTPLRPWPEPLQHPPVPVRPVSVRPNYVVACVLVLRQPRCLRRHLRIPARAWSVPPMLRSR